MRWIEGNGLVIAHRGACTKAPENTLAAFELAFDEGADGIELDVRALGDGTLVVHHDAAIGGRALADMDRAAFMDACDAAGHKGCTLGQVLRAAKGRGLVDIELKEAPLARAAVDALARHSLDPAAALVTSFWDDALATVHAIAPELTTGLLLGAKRPKRLVRTRLSEAFPRRRLRACEADLAVVHERLVHYGVLRRTRVLETPALVWTVNDEEQMARLFADPRVRGVITDDPELAIKVRDRVLS